VGKRAKVGLKIYVDFDGTITLKDVSDYLFSQLSSRRSEIFVEEYLAGKIGAQRCFLGECQASGAVRIESMNEIVDQQEIDPTFKDFVEFCESHSIPFYVLSDGFDYYIQRILRHHGLTQAKFISNQFVFQPVDGMGLFTLFPVFPYKDSECDWCANCKRNHLLTLSSETDIIVYVGDGYSDRCPSRYADIVFAKGSLIRYCREENISFFEYRSFKDVIDRLGKILVQKLVRKRWQAELRRREAFLQG
jgi:2-hydroxy-3-keto-5-methylthiopentenyl-1-phosphate phosphatase